MFRFLLDDLPRNDIIKVAGCPVYERLDGRYERLANICERVLHTWRNDWINLAMYQVALLQIFQRRGKHLLRTVGHVLMQLAETQHACLTGMK